MPETITLSTNHGPVEVLIEPCKNTMIQVNVPMPPFGAGFFLVFMNDEREQALEAAKALIEGEPLEGNVNIAHRVPGAVVAGTVPRPTFRMGTPKVEHKLSAIAQEVQRGR